jgi:hypothetical protein
MKILVVAAALLVVPACSVSEGLNEIMGRSPATPTTTTQEQTQKIDCDLIFPGSDQR